MNYLEGYTNELELTGRRLIALKRTQVVNPTWSAYDPYIDEVVSIDIRIEEQEAVRDEYSDQIALIDAERNRRLGYNQTIRMFR